MKSQLRSGDCVMTRSGRTWRMTRLMSRRKLQAGHDHAVGMSEEAHVVDPDRRGGGALLVLPKRSHVGPRHGAVGPSGVAVGDDAVGHLDAGRGKGGDGPGRPEVDVVWMRRDDEHTADAVFGRPVRDRGLGQSTPSSGSGVQAARSARRGSLENISTMGMRKPRRRWITSISTSWFHRARLTTTPAFPARAVRPERCR